MSNGSKHDPFHEFLEGDEPSVALSEDANNFFSELGTKVAVELESPIGIEKEGELSLDVKAIVAKLDKQGFADENLTRYQKSLAWTLTWVVIDRVGLLRLAAGTCLNDSLVLSLASRDKPIQLFLGKTFISWIFKTVYYAVCAALQAKLDVTTD